MATCKDCVHVEVCEDFTKAKLSPKRAEELLPVLREYGRTCDHFKDRSRFVELPDVGDYDTVTTIDEAIDHCYQIATSTDETVCAECKAEHMRLCGWLGDLKRRIAAEQAMPELTLEAAMIELNRLKSQERMEIDRERLIAAIDTLKDAARFRIKKEPNLKRYKFGRGRICQDYFCPQCDSRSFAIYDDFCPKCGQALDWSSL